MEIKKNETPFALYVLLFVVIIILGLNVYTLFFKQSATNSFEQKKMHGGFTEFDAAKAREFMDENNDGLCDACGMPIDQCIASGMMQCSMDKNAKIGLLGSQHSHADFKVHIDGKTVNFNNKNYFMKSSFIHVDDGENKEDASGVLHMHATGVSLSLFFESLGMKFTKNCLIISGKEHCGLKMYINGKENNELSDYVFKDLDKILITDNKGNVQEQMKSITNYAKLHSNSH